MKYSVFFYMFAFPQLEKDSRKFIAHNFSVLFRVARGVRVCSASLLCILSTAVGPESGSPSGACSGQEKMDVRSLPSEMV